MKKIICLIMCIIVLIACYNADLVGLEKSNRQESMKDEKNILGSTSAKNSRGGNVEISIDKNAMLNNLKNICSNPRKFGTNGEETSLNYLKNKLEEYGYITSIQDFPVYKQDSKSTHVKYNKDYFKENPYNSKILGTGRNIIARKDNYSNTKKTIYLTAHYDTTENTVGVMDNGTGVSVILEIANQLKNYDSPFNIIFVLFSGEEYFRAGSRAFVSRLTDKERENAIGAFNVDMVGEKDANGLIMRGTMGEHNILTLMMNNHLEKPLEVLEGGYSDELSFYLGKIPAITLTNKKPKLSRDREKEQLKYIDADELKNTAYMITKFLINFDNAYYKKLLEGVSFKSNRTSENTGLFDSFKAKKIKVVDEFKLVDINANLLENGYDSETKYIYEKEKGNKCIITERFNAFIDPKIYKNYKVLEGNHETNTDKPPLYLISANSGKDTKILYSIGRYYGEVKGDITIEKAINILRECYKLEIK